MPEFAKRLGATMPFIAAFIAVIVVSAGAVLTTSTGSQPAEPFTRHHAFRLMVDAGLTPGALAHAGYTGDEVDLILTAAEDHLDGPGRTTLDQIEQLAVSQSQCADLERTIRSGMAMDGDTSQLATLRLQCAQLEGAIAAARADLRDAALAGTAANKRAVVESIVANRDVDVPTEYKVLSRTPEGWNEIRMALRHARLLMEGNAEEDAELVQIAEDLDRNAAVILAANYGQDRSQTIDGRITQWLTSE